MVKRGAKDDSTEAQRAEQWREIGVGAQILRDLGISSIRLLASRARTWFLVPLACGLAVAASVTYFGPSTTGGGIEFAQHLVRGGDPAEFSVWATPARYFNTIFSVLSGASGGLLAPAIALGSGIGSLFTAVFPTLDPVLLMLAGMAAFLGSMLQAPFTATVLVMEMTNQHDIVLLLLLACLASSHVTRLLSGNPANLE